MADPVAELRGLIEQIRDTARSWYVDDIDRQSMYQRALEICDSLSATGANCTADPPTELDELRALLKEFKGLVAELKAENAALWADKERLDGGRIALGNTQYHEVDLRAAIDRAHEYDVARGGKP